jgi:hypothetical protein
MFSPSGRLDPASGNGLKNFVDKRECPVPLKLCRASAGSTVMSEENVLKESGGDSEPTPTPAPKYASKSNPRLSVQDISKLDPTKLTPLTPEVISRQATINIGTIGHVAHGKSTVVKGVQTIRFKNELIRTPQSSSNHSFTVYILLGSLSHD